nr:hypothetical protein [uncultured Allomuricauda sp.]
MEKKEKTERYISAIVFVFFVGFTFFKSFNDTENEKDITTNLKSIKDLTENIIGNLKKIDKELGVSYKKSGEILGEVSSLEEVLKKTNKLSGKLINNQSEIQNFLTGGDSFVFFHFGVTTFENNTIYYLTLNHHGKYSLRNFRIRIYDNLKYQQLIDNKSRLKKGTDNSELKESSIIYDSLYRIIYPKRKINIPDKIAKSLFTSNRNNVDFEAIFEGENGHFVQRFILLDIWGQPENATKLTKNQKTIWSDCFDDDFPKNINGEILWSNVQESYRILLENRKVRNNKH